MGKNSVSAFKVAATYIGTVVGAGFATGQEILQFFANFGARGLAGLLLATLLFVVFGRIVIGLGRRLGARSHQEIIRHSAGGFLGALMDWIIVFFLFGALTTMMAGSGALFAQQFGWPPLAGSLIMAALTAFTVLRGLDAVINAISYVAPFLILSVMLISLCTILRAPPDFTAAPPASSPGGGLIANWFLSAVLYVSYNLILSIAVLGPLGAKAQNSRAVKYGALWGGLGLGMAALMICLAMLSCFAQASRLEVPMVYIAGRISPLAQFFFALVLIAEVYTTAVSSLYGFATRLMDLERSASATGLIVGTAAAALLCSQLGFSNLVKTLYPLVGYAGLALLFCLAYGKLRHHGASRGGARR